MQKIEEINQLMMREHRLTFQKLEDKVIILNDNVKECYDKLNDLTAVRNLGISVDCALLSIAHDHFNRQTLNEEDEDLIPQKEPK